MGWLLELLFEAVRELCSQFIIDMMDIANGMFTEILSCDLERNGSMFADLLNYQKEEFWREHPVIELDTLWEHRKYAIFAAFYANEEEWVQESGRLYQILYKSGLSKTMIVRTLEEAGEYDTGITPEPECSILFLVTCSYREPGSRFVVASVLKNEYFD